MPKSRLPLVLGVVLVLVLGVPVVDGQDSGAAGVNEESLTGVAQSAGVNAEGELYTPMTFTIDVDPALYTNPFDASDIEVLGVFEAPSGTQFVISGFWMQPFLDTCAGQCPVENLVADGDPIWQVRFTPQEVGSWSYTMQVRDNGAVISSTDGGIEVAPSGRRGFVRVGTNNRYFQFDDGTTYLPIGHNLKWSWQGGGGIYAYDRWFASLRAAGGNYARIVIDVPWFVGLEWDGLVGDYREEQAAAARLDAIVELAARYDIQLQIVLLWHQSLTIYNGPPVLIPENPPRPDISADWDDNPYSVVNGGPLTGPAVFFIDERSQDLFRRRLRYIVARWGYSPNILAWEIIDEIDQVTNYEPETADLWVRSMASFIRQVDQHGHLITAGSFRFNPLLAANPLLDFTNTRFYQRRPLETTGEQVIGVVDTVQRNLQMNQVPVLLSGYSLNPWYEPTEDDPDGVHFQNSLWSALFSGAAGGAVSDWGVTYVFPHDLEQYYAPIAAYSAGIDWSMLNLTSAEAALMVEGESIYEPVRLDQYSRQFTDAPVEPVTRAITSDGVFPSTDDLPAFINGDVYGNPFQPAQSYRISVPTDTYLEVGVSSVSQIAGAQLRILIDEVQVAQLNLVTDSSDVSVRVPLSAGEHTITFENSGEDWFEIGYIEIGHLVVPARVLTLRDIDAGVALGWLQNRQYNWEAVAAGEDREVLTYQYRLDRMPPGRYVVDIWDPLTGAVSGEEIVRVGEDGVLRVDLVPLDRQLALRAFLQPEVPEADATAEVGTVPIAEITATSTPDVGTSPLFAETATPMP